MSKRRIFKKLVAVDGGGQLLAVVHGQRLGCFVVEGVGKAGTPKGCAQACPGCSGFVHAWNGPQGAVLPGWGLKPPPARFEGWG